MVLVLLLGCQPTISALQQDRGDIRTVVNVSWWSPEEAEGLLRYETVANGPQVVRATREAEDGGFRYRATALGLRSDSVSAAEACLLDGDTLRASAPLELRAGRLAVELPAVSVDAGMASSEGYLLMSFLRGPAAAVVLDAQGVPVWVTMGGEEGAVIPAIRRNPSGDSLLFAAFVHSQGPSESDDFIFEVSLDGNTRTRISTPGLHHDFIPLPDGTIAYIADDFREVDGELVHGDRIMERTPDGTLVEVWSAWDALPYTTETASRGDGWTHANAINYDPDEDAYYLSVHNYNTILKIDRSSGAVLWGLGGMEDDFGLTEALSFQRQHHFQLLEDRILLFNNGKPDEARSKVLELALDTDAMTADLAWSYAPADEVYSMVFGDVQRVSEGRTVVTYSGAGRVEMVSDAGALLWQLNTELGGVLGYSTYLDRVADLSGDDWTAPAR